MPLDSKSLLAKQRDEILKALVAACVDRKEGQRLVDLLAETDKMAAAVSDKPVGKPYASCRKAIDAIMMYLESRGRPATKDQIIEAVVEGGFLGNAEDAGLNVGKSIMIHLHGTGTKGTASGKIKAFGDVKRDPEAQIGLASWPEEKFTI